MGSLGEPIFDPQHALDVNGKTTNYITIPPRTKGVVP